MTLSKDWQQTQFLAVAYCEQTCCQFAFFCFLPFGYGMFWPVFSVLWWFLLFPIWAGWFVFVVLIFYWLYYSAEILLHCTHFPFLQRPDHKLPCGVTTETFLDQWFVLSIWCVPFRPQFWLTAALDAKGFARLPPRKLCIKRCCCHLIHYHELNIWLCLLDRTKLYLSNMEVGSRVLTMWNLVAVNQKQNINTKIGLSCTNWTHYHLEAGHFICLFCETKPKPCGDNEDDWPAGDGKWPTSGKLSLCFFCTVAWSSLKGWIFSMVLTSSGGACKPGLGGCFDLHVAGSMDLSDPTADTLSRAEHRSFEVPTEQTLDLKFPNVRPGNGGIIKPEHNMCDLGEEGQCESTNQRICTAQLETKELPRWPLVKTATTHHGYQSWSKGAEESS